MDNATRLDGKVAIITGGAGGIGSATARLMASRGATVVIADVALEAGQAIATSLSNAAAIPLDLEDAGSIDLAVAETVRRFGRVDILHNNAAMMRADLAGQDGDVEHMTTTLWDLTFAVNVRGTMLMSRAALPHLRETQGNIVNTVSTLALQGHFVQAAYASSKAAIIQMTRSIAASHGMYGVRCNAIAAGTTMTPGLRAAFPPPILEAVLAETLRDQLGDPEDIAEAVAFLASDAARNITGQVLVSDGGMSSHVAGMAALRSFTPPPV